MRCYAPWMCVDNKYIINSDVSIPNCFDIIMENEDFTIGKILEFELYDKYYLNEKTITFCGFSKPHPHINISKIRIGFKEPTDKNTVVVYLTTVAKEAITYYKQLLSELGVTTIDEPPIEAPPIEAPPIEAPIEAPKAPVAKKKAPAAAKATKSKAPIAEK